MLESQTQTPFDPPAGSGLTSPKPLGQKPNLGAEPAPTKKQGAIGRLFGLQPKTTSQNSNIKPAVTSKQDWTPLDVSHGRFNNPDLHKLNKFRYDMNKDLRSTLRNPSLRKDVINELGSKRSHGFSRIEIKESLRKLRDEGKLSSLKYRQLKRKFGAF